MSILKWLVLIVRSAFAVQANAEFIAAAAEGGRS